MKRYLPHCQYHQKKRSRKNKENRSLIDFNDSFNCILREKLYQKLQSNRFEIRKILLDYILYIRIMKEIISIHVGQGGIKAGNASWELFCLQHGIQPDGFMPDAKKNQLTDNLFTKFFKEQKTPGKYTPRSVYIDLDRQTIDQVRFGEYRHLFDRDLLVSGKQDSGNNFARGYNTLGQQFADLSCDRIRKAAEQSDNLEGFIIYNSVGGGTGSGLGSLLLQKISSEYQGKTKAGFTIFPSQKQSKIVVDPYNTILATKKILDNMDINIPIDNEAVYRLCEHNLKIQTPKYSNLNRLIAHIVSQTTICMRQESCLNISLSQLQTNLIPFPRVMFITPAYSPIKTNQMCQIEELSLTQMTLQCYKRQNQLINCDPQQGKFMACSLYYRGSKIIPKNVGAAFCTLKTQRTINFVDWCPTGFKVGINYNSRNFVPGDQLGQTQNSVFALSNQTAVKQLFGKMRLNFTKMFKKKAFLHWFTNEGITEETLAQAGQEILTLQADYKQVEFSQDNEDVQQG